MSLGIAKGFGLSLGQFPRVLLKSEAMKKAIPSGEHDSLIMVDRAVTTWERFDNFDDSLCHVMSDGRIMRYGVQIGTAEDIEVRGKPS